MSSAEVLTSHEALTSSRVEAPSPQPRRSARGMPTTRLLRSELRLIFGRRRNQALLVVLGLVPLLVGIAVYVSRNNASSGGDGPPFLDRVTGNGLFLAFAALAAVVPFFLPLATGVVSGDAVAGEAQAGTLRYLLTVPVSRGRLLAVKFGGLLAYALAATLLVAAVGLATGAVLFPISDVTLLSGTSVSIMDAIGRAVLVALYVTVSLGGLAALGLAVSTFTEVPVAAMATTVVLAITSQIMDAIPQINWIHPYLFSHQWLAFGDLLRDPVPTGNLVQGLLLQLCWGAVALAIAWSRFTTKDVTS